MSQVRFDAEAGAHFPQLDRVVPGTSQNEVARREELDTTHVVVVAVQRLRAVKGLEGPELDRQVGAAGGQQLADVGLEADRVDCCCVAFQDLLQVAVLVVPDADRAVLGGGGEDRVDGVERETCDRLAVAQHVEFLRGPGQVLGDLVGVGEFFAGAVKGHFFLERVDFGLKTHNFLL